MKIDADDNNGTLLPPPYSDIWNTRHLYSIRQLFKQ